jgi:hypothetical protein
MITSLLEVCFLTLASSNSRASFGYVNSLYPNQHQCNDPNKKLKNKHPVIYLHVFCDNIIDSNDSTTIFTIENGYRKILRLHENQ